MNFFLKFNRRIFFEETERGEITKDTIFVNLDEWGGSLTASSLD